MEPMTSGSRVDIDEWRTKIGLEISDRPLPTRMRLGRMRTNLFDRSIPGVARSRIGRLTVLCLGSSFVLRILRVRA